MGRKYYEKRVVCAIFGGSQPIYLKIKSFVRWYWNPNSGPFFYWAVVFI